MLKVGIIGLGFISQENVLGYLDFPAAQIVAVCEQDSQRTADWLAKWRLSGVRSYVNIDDMLAAESLDIVDILTPHVLHCDHVLKCAAARVKGISVQKPMAVGLAQCDRMIEACGQAGVTLRVYENYIFYPIYRRAKQMIADGAIGRPMSIRVHTMAGIREGAAWPRFWDPAGDLSEVDRCGNSPLVADDGLHKFELVSWFLDQPIERVGAWIDPSTPLDAPAFVRLRFAATPSAPPQYGQLDFNFSHRLDIPSDLWLDDFVEIFGERGVMWVNQCAGAGGRPLFRGVEMSASPVFPPIVVFRGGKVTTYLTELTPAARNWSTSFVNCTRHFVDVIQNGGQPVCTGEEGKRLNRYAIAALLSAQEGRDVEVDEVTTDAEVAGRIALRTNFCNKHYAK